MYISSSLSLLLACSWGSELLLVTPRPWGSESLLGCMHSYFLMLSTLV